MGKLIYSLNVSLDGFVATTDGSLEWVAIDEEVHRWFNDQTRSVAASLYGRRMYEVMAGYWPTAEDDPATSEVERDFARIWNRLPKVVFSRSLGRVDHGARLVHGDVGPILDELRHEFDGDLEVGGPELAGQFVTRGLVDEYQLVVHPVALGSGKPFWPSLELPLRLRLTDRHTFASGAEARTYVPQDR
jgi:dihydrofolate reductase